MRSRLGRTSTAALLLPLLVATMAGCQLNRSFFQMDSDSRVPFFGVDLTPRWPGRSSAMDGVSRLQSDATQTARPDTDTDEAADKPQKPRRLKLPVATSSRSAAPADAAPVEQFR